MNVTHRLTAVSAAVIYDAEALFKVFLLRDLCDRLEDLCDKAAVLSGYFCGRSDMLPRDNDSVKGSLRVDVGKGIDPLVLIYLCRGDFPCGYFTK